VFQRQPRFLGLPRNQPARDFRAFRLKSPWLPRSTRLPARPFDQQFPLVGRGDNRGARHYLGSPGRASLEVESACEVLCVAPAAVRWPSPRSLPSTCFHAAASIPVELPSPEPASSRFILPWQSLLLRVPSLKSPAHRLSTTSSPTQGLFPHRGIVGARPQLRRLPSPRYVPSSGFLNLSTVFSALRLCELIPSRSHVQGCRRSGASLPAQTDALIERRFPLAVVLMTTARVGPSGSLTRYPPRSPSSALMRPRLRGFTPREGALRTVWVSASPHLAPLFGFFSSRSSTTAFGSSLPGAIRPRRSSLSGPSSAYCSGGLDF
jgi:hypothetical protein